MTRLAVDIVLLPERKMTDYAVDANAELVKNFNSEIVLNAQNCLPHISLAMGCIEPADVIRIGELLAGLVPVVPKKIMPAGIQKIISSPAQTVSTIQIRRTDMLLKLHEKICFVIKPFFMYEASEEMTADGQASQSTLQWINTYPDKSSHANFSPHITIGYGELSGRALPHDFEVSRMAICHLGNHCTCREILWSIEL